MLYMLILAGLVAIATFLAICIVGTDREADDKEQLEWIQEWSEKHKQI